MTPARALPASIEAEESLVSCALIDASHTLAKSFAAGISPLSFSDPDLGTLWSEITDMHAAGQPVDPQTLWERLTVSQRAGAIGMARFMAITGRSQTTAHAAHYTDRVAFFHGRRQVIRLATRLVEAAFSTDDDESEIRQCLSRLNLLAGGTDRTEKLWPAVVADAVAHTKALIARLPEAMAGQIGWPWPTCDRNFMPMAGGELVVLAARPSVGKSSMTRALCLFHAKAGRNVMLVTLEDSRQTVAMQGAASASGHSASTIADRHAAEQAEFLESLAALALPNLHVFENDASLAAISARAKAIHARTPLAFLAVDQLAQITDGTPMRGENKPTAIGRVTGALKRLARELGCPLLLPHQLSREGEKDGNRVPVLTDLRDSGSVEQDADRVIFLHRPDVDPLTKMSQVGFADSDDRPQFYVNAIQAKGRAVGAGQLVGFYFRRKTATFIPAKL